MGDVLRVVIVDDEAPAREGLRLRLRKEPGVRIVGEFADAKSALVAIRADPPDVLFLDIEMPGANGFQLLQKAGDIDLPAVVFVTAHDAHAVKAFGVRALDYLLKPVEQDRLQEALARARQYWDSRRKSELADRVRSIISGQTPQPAPAVAPQSGSVVRIPVRRDGAIHFVNASDIDWIDAAGDSVRLHTGKVTHVLRKSMGDMIAMLDAKQFVRIHRSTIVNIARVRELQPWFHGEYVVVLVDGTKLKLSRGHREKLSALLGGLPGY
jgi:two-component system LytT family response regulator